MDIGVARRRAPLPAPGHGAPDDLLGRIGDVGGFIHQRRVLAPEFEQHSSGPRGGRIVAIGTTVVRALEAAGAPAGILHAGNGVATGRIGAGTKLRIVDAVLTGAHEPGTSHHSLLGAFLGETMLRRVDAALAANHYRTHEFGESVLVERGVDSEKSSATSPR
jgi:hypothetical protein